MKWPIAVHLQVLPCGLGASSALKTLIAHHNPFLLAPPHEILKQGTPQTSSSVPFITLEPRVE